jgi:hypothetical protein
MQLSREQSKMIADGHGKCRVQCQGCGCQGGPGYRTQTGNPAVKGRCVGYRDLVGTCGPSPHARCDFECKPAVEQCAAPTVPTQQAAEQHQQDKKQRRKSPHVRAVAGVASEVAPVQKPD